LLKNQICNGQLRKIRQDVRIEGEMRGKMFLVVSGKNTEVSGVSLQSVDVIVDQRIENWSQVFIMKFSDVLS
jgi:hypothetical protein